MKTLFAKFLLWFWLGLAVVLAAEYALESTSLQQGLAVRSVSADGHLFMYADLARTMLAERGLPGLDRLIARTNSGGAVEIFRSDSGGSQAAPRALPPEAARAGLAALHTRGGTLVETHEGLFVAYPIGSSGGREYALVIHPRPRRGSSSATTEDGDEPHLLPFLPPDMAERALLMLLFGGIGCYVLARYVTAPVIRLRRATRRIAEGDLTARVGSAQRRRRDELEDLGRDFDQMAERLEALVGAQRRLLADLSHELRSPLARMNVAVTLLRQGHADDTAEMIERLETESARLDGLIGDVLTLSRSESGEPVPELQRVDLGELTRGIADDARFEAAGERADVQVTCPESVVVTGSPGLLRSAIDNVVRNAIRHTRAGSAVEIAVECRTVAGGREATVAVRDHGPGLPADQLERIFEPFYRFEGTPARHPGGTGLGLAIAKRIVARHGGSICAEAAPSEGLLVTVRLPAA